VTEGSRGMRHRSGGAAPRVLCVDDEPVTLLLMGRLLERAGLGSVAASTPDEAIRLFETESFDMVVTDIRMPGMDGLAFVHNIRERDANVPVIVATGHATLENAIRALHEGASGMLMKPFTAEEFVSEIQHALERAQIRHEAMQYRFVTPILDGVALALTAAIEARHLETGRHCRQLGYLGEQISERIGLPEQERTTVRIGGYLHDVGKIAIADRILLKPGPLTDDEMAEMRRHSEIGASIVETHEGMAQIAQIVRHHHERWDGAGYPFGIARTSIPIGARIISVVDAFSAMTNDRVYRPALDFDHALRELREHAGRQFDPAIVEVFTAELEAGLPIHPPAVVPA